MEEWIIRINRSYKITKLYMAYDFETVCQTQSIKIDEANLKVNQEKAKTFD
jgi:hypothetical protein